MGQDVETLITKSKMGFYLKLQKGVIGLQSNRKSNVSLLFRQASSVSKNLLKARTEWKIEYLLQRRVLVNDASRGSSNAVISRPVLPERSRKKFEHQVESGRLNDPLPMGSNWSECPTLSYKF